jgi:hypothetical protein
LLVAAVVVGVPVPLQPAALVAQVVTEHLLEHQAEGHRPKSISALRLILHTQLQLAAAVLAALE